jgi:hypothetical protein
MYYAVDTNTKRHRIAIARKEPHEVWVEADKDGWIKHDGGECPLPSGIRFDAKMRDGVIAHDEPPTCGDGRIWKHLWGEADIIAYRPILDDKEQDMSDQEWSGVGLPPVGTECEYFDAIAKEWGPAAVVAHHINGEEAIWSRDMNGGELFYGSPHDFRPLHTAAQRAEDEAVEAMKSVTGDGFGCFEVSEATARAICAAIRDGRIPGVKLED